MRRLCNSRSAIFRIFSHIFLRFRATFIGATTPAWPNDRAIS